MRLGWKGLAGFGALCKVFAFSVVLTLALASAAFADQVTNRVDTSPDATLENVTLNEGAAQTVAFRVTTQGNDGDGGCNIDSGEQLTVEVSSSDTSVATLSPQTITLTGCNQNQSVTITALARGTATITAAQAPGSGSNTTGSGTYDYTPASFTVTVNAPPTISDIPDQTTTEDTPTGDIPFTVGDAETPASGLTVTGSSSNTTLVPNSTISFGGSGANRTVKATPAANRSGTATITVSVSDGAAATTDTFVLTVNPVNDPPEIDLNGGAAGKDYSAVFTEDTGPVAIVNRNTLTVTDIDSNDLISAAVNITNLKDGNAESLAADTAGTSIAATYDATTGELSLTGTAPVADYQKVLRTVTYDNASQNPDTADRSVTFVVNDGTASSNTATSTVRVNTVNDAPTVAFTGGPTQVDESGTEARTYTFEITDPDSNIFSFTPGYPDCGGGDELVGTPQIGDRSFECRFPDGPTNSTVRIQVTDSQGADSNVATKEVEVNNVAPSISLSGPDAAEEGDTKQYSFTVTDPGDDTHTIVTACGGNGNEVASSDTYDPGTGEGSFECRFPDGPATSNVTARVTDSDGASDSDNRVVVVTVANIAPVARDDAYDTNEDEPLVVSAPGVLGNDEDAAGGDDALEARLVADPSNGTLTLNGNGSLTYEPDANFNGTDSFTYRANDGTEDGNNATVTVTVRPVNDKPSFVKGEDPSVVEDSGDQEFPGWATGISAGPANESDQTVWFEVSNVNAASGDDAMFTEWPELSPSGKLTFTTAPNASGEATFDMRLMDDGGRAGGGEDASDEQRFKITVGPIDDHPTKIEFVRGPGKVREGQTKTYRYQVEDIDDPTPIVESCGAKAEKIDTLAESSFNCFFPDGPGRSTVSIRAGPDSPRDKIKVEIANVAPEVILNGPGEAEEGQKETYEFTINDPGDDAFSFAAGYPKCGLGGRLADNPSIDGGRFRCEFLSGLAMQLVALKVKDSDGAFSNEAIKEVMVKSKARDLLRTGELEGAQAKDRLRDEADSDVPDAQYGTRDDSPDSDPGTDACGADPGDRTVSCP